MVACRIDGNGGGSAEESPCDETAIFHKRIFLQIALWPLSKASTLVSRAAFISSTSDMFVVIDSADVSEEL